MKKLAFFLAAIAISSPILATPVQYIYSGQITDIRDYNGTGIDSIIKNGDKFQGSFYYDPEAPLQYLIEPGRGLFAGPSNLSSASTGPVTVSESSGEVQLFDNYNGTDMLFLPVVDNDLTNLPGSLDGYAGVIRVQLYGDIQSMTLPKTLDLGKFGGQFSITGYSSTGAAPSYFSWHVGGSLQSLTAVPEPASPALLLAGVLSMGAIRLTSKSKKFPSDK